jgi:hypothetical protein
MRHHNFYDELDDLNDVQMHSQIGSLGTCRGPNCTHYWYGRLFPLTMNYFAVKLMMPMTLYGHYEQ